MKNFQDLQYVSPSQAVSANSFFRPVRANFSALSSTNAGSGGELIGVNRTPLAYTQSGSSVTDHLIGIDNKLFSLSAAASGISAATVIATSTPTNYSKNTSSVEGHLMGINTAIGTKENTIAGAQNGAFYAGDKTFKTVNSLVVAATATPSNYSASAANVDSHLKGVDTAIGTKEPSITAAQNGAFYAGDKTFKTVNSLVVAATATPTNYTPSASNVDSHLKAIDTVLAGTPITATFTATESISTNDAVSLGVKVQFDSGGYTGSYGAYGSSGDIYGNLWIGQTFTTGASSFGINGARVYIGQSGGSASGYITIAIRDVTGTSADLAAYTVPVSSWNNITNSVYADIVFPTPAICLPSTQYSIIARAPSLGGGSNKVFWYGTNPGSGSVYSGGNPISSGNSGSTWSADTTYDRNFIIRELDIIPGTIMKSNALSSGDRGNSFIGFANTSVSSGQNVNVTINGIKNGFSNLTTGTKYYLSDTLGGISTIPVSGSRSEYSIGVSNGTQSIIIDKLNKKTTQFPLSTPVSYATNAVWVDLDLSSIVGVGRRMVLLRIVTGGSQLVGVMRRGESKTNGVFAGANAINGASQYLAYLITPTDEYGWISYYASTNAYAFTLSVESYW